MKPLRQIVESWSIKMRKKTGDLKHLISPETVFNLRRQGMSDTNIAKKLNFLSANNSEYFTKVVETNFKDHPEYHPRNTHWGGYRGYNPTKNTRREDFIKHIHNAAKNFKNSEMIRQEFNNNFKRYWLHHIRAKLNMNANVWNVWQYKNRDFIRPHVEAATKKIKET